jgi:para-nitrobenzyl esterase
MDTVPTQYGLLKGVPGRDENVTVFKGIPYARPPVGMLRFTPPQRPLPWAGVLLCDKFSASAVQHKPFGDPDVREIGEDCLYLNIWAPAGAAGKTGGGPAGRESERGNCPVMFWIHGGGFVTGCGTSPEFDGEAFARKGVILVTVNYRLGALGFLALDALKARDGTTGNYGLLDQIAALSWVRGNIGAFGGDADNITVFGFSAGGMSARMLMCSPRARHMMRRVIVESGGGVTDSDNYRPLDEKIGVCRRGMDRLGWTADDLMKKDAGEVNDMLRDATAGELESWEKSVFQPDIDGDILTVTPGVGIWKGECADIPVIAGSVSGDSGWIKIVRHEVADERMIPAFVYSRGVSWAIRQTDTGRRPIFTYHFERTQPPARQRGLQNPTPHGSEIRYVMGMVEAADAGNGGFTAYDKELSEAMVDYWTNFAKTGDPNGEGLKPWPAYTKENPVSMHFTDMGYAAEELARNPAAKQAVRFAADHPGLIKSLREL